MLLQHSQAQTLQEWGLKHAAQHLANATTQTGQPREAVSEEHVIKIF